MCTVHPLTVYTYTGGGRGHLPTGSTRTWPSAKFFKVKKHQNRSPPVPPGLLGGRGDLTMLS